MNCDPFFFNQNFAIFLRLPSWRRKNSNDAIEHGKLITFRIDRCFSSWKSVHSFW